MPLNNTITTTMTTKNYFLRIGVILVFFVLSNVTIAQTYTFTPALAEGNVGPTQVETDLEYTGTTLDGLVTTTAGIQYWVVPTALTV